MAMQYEFYVWREDGDYIDTETVVDALKAIGLEAEFNRSDDI